MKTTIKKTDAQIQGDVMNELRWDTRVKETDVGVEVDHGVVTLTGTVDSWAARLAAQEAAHRVAGVLDVANDIHVKLPQSAEITDTDLAAAVRGALHWHALVPHERITSTVSNGVVTLEGTVDYWSERQDAGDAVKALRGAREVRNFIAVEPSTRAKVGEAELRKSIEAALERHALHAARHVEIEVKNGAVTLKGMIPSWRERRAVVGAARGTPGVAVVDDADLHIGVPA